MVDFSALDPERYNDLNKILSDKISSGKKVTSIEFLSGLCDIVYICFSDGSSLEIDPVDEDDLELNFHEAK